MKFKLIAITALLSVRCMSASAQGTAFTYQGLLISGGNPANGSYDLTFTLFNVNTTGAAIAGPVTNSATAVSNGLFTTVIDFGAGVFTAGSNWLEIALCTNGSASFSTLTPRQQLTPAPYALTAENALTAQNLAGVVANNTITAGVTATVGGGVGNTSSGSYDTVSGGEGNTSSGLYDTVSGGQGNTTSGSHSTVGGGYSSTSSGDYATVAGGYENIASAPYAAVGGGNGNTASGQYATVAGGHANVASGDFSFAGGNHAQALYQGSFVWADDNGGNFASTAANQFSVRATGGVLFNATGGITLAGDMQMGTSAGDYHHFSIGGGNSYGYIFGSYLNPSLGDGIHMGYNWYSDAAGTGHIINAGGGSSRISLGYESITMQVAPVGYQPVGNTLVMNSSGTTIYGTFNNSSDRNVKQNVAPVSSSQILDKVLQLPISEWSYKTDSATRHIGPMGQDFYSVFNIGTDEKHIAPIDEGGVALAAIQGLNQKLDSEAKEKDAQIQLLEKKLDELRAMVKQLAAQE